MKHQLVAFLCAFSLISSATAREGHQIAVQLAVGSGARMQIGDDGTGVAGLAGEKLDPPTAWVRSVARHFTDGEFGWAVGDKAALLTHGAVGVEADPVTPGVIHIAFRAIGDSDHRLLVIANGYDRALVYRARIRVKGEDRYTDVCTVLPGVHGVEHWPYAIEQITLTDLHLEAWTEGKTPRCE